jgi:CxxC motif-containing protein
MNTELKNSEKKILTCIICPMGCQLEVTEETGSGTHSSYSVTGNSCSRGAQYAQKELTNPTRTLTCSVAVRHGVRRLVPAKSVPDVPRDRQLECMEVIRRLSAEAPVHTGDVLCADILNTGADIIACDDIPAR